VARRWLESATLSEHPYLVPDAAAAPVPRDAFPWTACADWRDDVMRCVERLSRVGLETFMLDQTQPDIGLPVCRMVVPGLCHFWRRLGFERLYEVPVRMGWQASQKTEAELNQSFIYF
jgi:oxazoline/thiazoline synthase